jgi:Uma2 family endonuclease
MTLSITNELADHPELAYRHTVDEYHQMLKTGSIEEGAPFELLDGQIVRKIRSAHGESPMTIGTRHTVAVLALGELNSRLVKLKCHMRLQAPVTLPPHDEPEPDGAIVRGKINDYRLRHPAAADVLCVIEIADASLRRDRGYKQQLYANSGIPMYVIANLLNNTIELRTNPVKDRYSDTVVLKRIQKLSLPTASGKKLIVPAKLVLP